MIYVKENQYTEEDILDNNEASPLFEEFLQILGEKVKLKGKSSKNTKVNRKLERLHGVTTGWRL